MPIKSENKPRYGTPKEWKAISTRIRERDGYKCVECGLAHGTEGYRLKDGTFYTTEQFSNDWINTKHEDELCELVGKKKPMKIVLTCAHLDHTPENMSDSNLASMCQYHHLRYDAVHHANTARTTRNAKRKQLSLF